MAASTCSAARTCPPALSTALTPGLSRVLAAEAAAAADPRGKEASLTTLVSNTRVAREYMYWCIMLDSRDTVAGSLPPRSPPQANSREATAAVVPGVGWGDKNGPPPPRLRVCVANHTSSLVRGCKEGSIFSLL